MLRFLFWCHCEQACNSPKVLHIHTSRVPQLTCIWMSGGASGLGNLTNSHTHCCCLTNLFWPFTFQTVHIKSNNRTLLWMINFDCDKTDQPLSNLMSPFSNYPSTILGTFLKNFQLFSATESRNLTTKEGGEMGLMVAM